MGDDRNINIGLGGCFGSLILPSFLGCLALVDYVGGVWFSI